MATVQARVLYDFEAQPGSSELGIREGEILTITSREVGEGWWEGTNASGKSGLFPASYVEAISAGAPPHMPPPPLPSEYSNLTDPWGGDDWSGGPLFSPQPPVPAKGGQGGRDNLASQSQQGGDNDDWDDEWDDDDSDAGAGHVNGASYGLNISRMGRSTSNSGDNTSLASGGKGSAEDKDKVYIEEGINGPRWRPNVHAFTCAISSPKKESKFHGIKSFIAYMVLPSFSTHPVSRRYKQFDWLQVRLSDKFPLIPIPPLPEKQISGRFEDDLIEYRMTMLQSWIDRICRHPVLAQCEVFHHFVTCPNDEKKWKAGKRRAESDKLVGANFYLAVERPETVLDLPHLENRIEGYTRFFSSLDESVKLLQNTSLDQTKKHQTVYKREYTKISHAFSKLSRAFDVDPSNSSPKLTDAVRHVSDAYSDIGTIFEEEPRHDWDPLCNLMFEYKGLIDGFPAVINVTKGAISKRRQMEKEAQEGRLDHEDVPPVIQRSETIAYALHAEVEHFQRERREDFKRGVISFLTEQINFYQKIADRLRDSLHKFNDVD